MLGELVGYIGGAVALLVIVLLLILRARARRSRQSKRNDLHQLKPGKAFREFEWPTAFTEDTLAKLRQYFASQNFRLIDNVADGIIAYSGKSEHAALKGWLTIDPMLLPIRIVVKANASQKIVVRMDDDYGFQVLNTSMKAAYQEKCDVKFLYVEEEMRRALRG